MDHGYRPSHQPGEQKLESQESFCNAHKCLAVYNYLQTMQSVYCGSSCHQVAMVVCAKDISLSIQALFPSPVSCYGSRDVTVLLRGIMESSVGKDL